MRFLKVLFLLTIGAILGVLGVFFYQLWGRPVKPMVKVRKATPEEALVFFLKEYVPEIVTKSEKVTLEDTQPVKTAHE